MSIFTDQFMDDLITGLEDITNIASPSVFGSSLEDYLHTLNTMDDFQNSYGVLMPCKDIKPADISNFAAEFNLDSYSSTDVSQNAAAFSFEISSRLESLQMIEQPFQCSKLRYRSDYIREKARLGVLTNKNEQSKIKGPAIKIPQCYLNTNEDYYIRVCLVTVKYQKANLHYIHPYELENPCDEQLNDRRSNSVWFPIKPEDSIGTMSFPFLRIVKQSQSDLQKLDHLRVFDSHDHNLESHFFPKFCFRVKTDIIQEYNLERSRLAFTVGKKVLINGQPSTIFYPHTTIFSDEIIESAGKELGANNDHPLPPEKQSPPPTECHVYKYNPRRGLAESNEEMLVFLKNKLESKKYGKLQVTVECSTSNCHWSQAVLDLEAKDRMISFKIPIFPYSITKTMPVIIKLQQDSRILGLLKYSYLSTSQCQSCHARATKTKKNTEQTIPKKHRMSRNHSVYLETKTSVIPAVQNTHAIRQSIPEPESLSTSNTSNFAFLSSTNTTDYSSDYLQKQTFSLNTSP